MHSKCMFIGLDVYYAYVSNNYLASVKKLSNLEKNLQT